MSLRRNVVAYLALFIALGGTSYAAMRLPAGSVGTRQLKDGAVTGMKVRPHSLTSNVFKPGTLPPTSTTPGTSQIQTTVLTGYMSFDGSCSGTTGGTSACGLFGSQSYDEFCASDQHVVGGGFDIPAGKATSTNGSEIVTASRPFTAAAPPPGGGSGGGSGSEGWTVSVYAPQGTDESGTSVYAICAS